MEWLQLRTPKGDSTGASTAGPAGEWRSVGAVETVERVRPHFEELGITRLANVTGLDRIGIPVWQAVRPNSRGLAVAQGKGVTHDLARASAVMESLEAHHAELVALPCRIESWARLRDLVPVVDPDALPLSRDSLWTPHRPIPWVEATDLATGGTAWVPYELVHANSVLPRVPGSGCFVCSTNGLASGNTLGEAVLHGLCELVERDAHALWWIADRGGEPTRVDLATVRDPVALDLLDLYDRAGVDLAVWDMTSDVAVPAYRAIIADRGADDLLHPVPAAYGAGCHPDPRVALQRALVEAAQSRLTAIAGSRDDLTRARYHEVQSAEALTEHRDLAACPATVDAGRHPRRGGDTVEDDVRAVLAALAARGLGPVLVVDLSRPGWPVHVVRMVVAGVEGTSVVPSYRPGARARQAAIVAAARAGERRAEAR